VFENAVGDEITLNRVPFDSQSLVSSDRSSQTNEISRSKTSDTGRTVAKQPAAAENREPDSPFNPRYVEFFKLLAAIDATGGEGKLFTKKCRVCEKEFSRFSEYLCATTPKGHVFEDCEEVMGKPFTMMYRHCPCGNTLVISLTDQNFPPLNRLWAMLREEASASNRPLLDVVKEFSRQCDQFVLGSDNPCTNGKKRL
jgi:hypothetical protein